MSTDTQVPNPGINTHNILNLFLMLLNCLLAVSFASFLTVMRKIVVGDAALGVYQGPALVDFLLRKEFITVTVLLIVVMVIKEITVKPIKSRLFINLLISTGIFVHGVIVFIVPFIYGLV